MNIYIISWTWGEEQGLTTKIFLYKSKAEKVCEELNRDEGIKNKYVERSKIYLCNS